MHRTSLAHSPSRRSRRASSTVAAPPFSPPNLAMHSIALSPASASPSSSPPSSPTASPPPEAQPPPTSHSTLYDLLTDIANMLKAFIGLNFMYIAYSFSKAGLSRAIPSLLVITLLTEHCCILLVRVKNSTHPNRTSPPPTYGDIAHAVGGKPLQHIVNIALIMTQFGYCVGYLIFLSSTLHHLLPPPLQSTYPTSLFVLPALPFLSLLSLLTSIRHLGPFSLAANIALLTGFISVVFFLATHYHWAPTQPPLSQFPLFFGQITAALEGIGLVIPVEASMKQRHHFRLVLRTALAILTTVLMVVGVMGFATFGDNTSSILLVNFGHSPVVALVKAVLVVGILLTYPLQIVPVFQFLETCLLSDHPTQHINGEEGGEEDPTRDILLHSEEAIKSDEEQSIPFKQPTTPPDASDATAGVEGTAAGGRFVKDGRRVAIRLCVVGVSGVTAMLAGREFGLVQSLVGSMGASCLAYTAPAWLHYRRFGGEGGWLVRLKDLGIVLFGVVGGVVGTVVAVRAFVAGEGEG